jgi:flavin-dependent dehydrogenase
MGWFPPHRDELMPTIKIIGGGIAGLTAAINLRRAGRPVEVHERKGFCGKKSNDFQFLENWTDTRDVLDLLRECNVDTGFYAKPWFANEFLGPSNRHHIGRSKAPLMYLVKRGIQEGSIDRCLHRQALACGVRVIHRSNLSVREADIVATGPGRPSFIAVGVKFGFSGPDRSVVLLDNRLSRHFYSYFIVNDCMAEITCVNSAGTMGLLGRLERTIRAFEHRLGIPIGPVEERFAGKVCFGREMDADLSRRYYIGEAAGFQDALAGFGMVYAFKSGYYAARSLVEKSDYDRQWKKDFGRLLYISGRNRRQYNRLTNRDLEALVGILNSSKPLIRAFTGGTDLRRFMRRLYTSPILPVLMPLFMMKRPALRPGHGARPSTRAPERPTHPPR